MYEVLQQNTLELEKAKAVAEKANLAKSDFLSSMSHELRSPLNAILGFAQLMDSDTPPPTPSQKGGIDQILHAGWYLLELIGEILDLAVIESGRLSLSLEAVSLPDVMMECQSMIEPQAQKRGMRDPDAMEIINNRERIERANASAVDKYLQVLDKYLTDDTVRKEVRLALMEKLAKYRKIQSWEKRPNLARVRSVEPTVAEMRNRSEILLTRVEQIISSHGKSDEMAKIKNLSTAILQDSQKLYEQAQVIEKEEAELLAETGNQLFKD